MENNVLVIDDKAGKVDELIQSNDIGEKNEGENLQFLIQGIRNNSLNPIFLEDLTDVAETRKFINKQSNIKAVVLDLNLNSSNGVDPQDIDQLKFLLLTLQKKFGKFLILVFSSLANEWPDVQNELERDNPELRPLFSPPNVKVLEKGGNKEAIIYDEIQSISDTIQSNEGKIILLESKVILCKNWITEWLFMGIILTLVNIFSVPYKILPSIFHHIIIECGFVAVITKVIIIERKRIKILKQYLNK